MTHHEGARHETTVASGDTLLRSLLAAGVDAPYSCETGVCGTCKGRLRSGTVHAASQAGLEKAEVETGWVLTCQSRPTSSEVEIELAG
ncbi:MAG: 2Fe-2S iron-sulfur cluster binding domain-containing protein [Acidobacteriota bacterium]